MARPAAYALLATVFARAISASLEFTNPLPYNTDGNVSNYQTYKKGHSLLVLWSGGDPSENVSILLVQQDFHSLVYSESLRGVTGFEWLVDTARNLTDSNLFSLAITQGSTQSSASQYLFIEEDFGEGSDSDLSSSSAISPTATSNGASTVTRTAASHSAFKIAISTSSNLPTIKTNVPNLSTEWIINDGFPLGAKLSLGVGIPVAIVLGLLAGWLTFRRQKRDIAAHKLPTSVNEQLEPERGRHNRSIDRHEAPDQGLHEAAVNHVHEVPPNQRLEIGQSEEQGLSKRRGEVDNNSTLESVRYEMDAGSPMQAYNQTVK
ncbi:hypothetical protein CC77DRAFT_1083125 [Alternaria alternata]|uniref:Mid2 domain-containing protein n=1 Tax=Alternaria alternata TaxID=5599 RepID=A0A177D4Q7_ALTAL|nr:hypothetical protein CC77DRAFT_1083125 [Alternaria alternata]OAG14217.1 hypothetical protein CC77DRAFT_1083125 [Alternaria alternata]